MALINMQSSTWDVPYSKLVKYTFVNKIMPAFEQKRNTPVSFQRNLAIWNSSRKELYCLFKRGFFTEQRKLSTTMYTFMYFVCRQFTFFEGFYWKHRHLVLYPQNRNTSRGFQKRSIKSIRGSFWRTYTSMSCVLKSCRLHLRNSRSGDETS